MKEETKKLLFERTESDILNMTKALDESNRIFTALNNAERLGTEKNIQVDLHNLKRLVEYRTLIGILHLDINVAMRIYLSGKFQYEGLYAARQIIVIISEGFKKIFNFANTNKGKDRLESFWIKDIKTIIDSDLPHLESAYHELTEDLDIFCENNFSDKEWKNKRDLSVHYDKNPSDFYSMLIGLDIEEILLKMVPFLGLLNRMFAFTHTVIKAYQQINNEKNKKFISQIDHVIDMTKKAFDSKEKGETIENGVEMLLKMKELLLRNENKTNT